VLEASLVFHGGLVIPLLSEFLEHALGDNEAQKQDCELRGFVRLSDRLKRLFPRLPILLVLDGLYANGPVMQRCLRAQWQFMIVLRDKDLSSVWEEFRALQPRQSQTLQQNWGQRQQRFSWVNDIEYAYGSNGRCRLKLHVVVCEESWERVDQQAAIVTETARHAWLSSQPLSRENVHERCNLGARHRWGIEAGFLVEKHQGYHYEHAFALDWNAMRGYHLLMRLAHVFNTLARFTRQLRGLYRQFGVRGAIAFIRNSCAAPWLDPRGCAGFSPNPFSCNSSDLPRTAPGTIPRSVQRAGKASHSDRTGAPAAYRHPLHGPHTTRPSSAHLPPATPRSDRPSGESGGFRQTGPIWQGHASGL
jgi:hypothetical protein